MNIFKSASRLVFVIMAIGSLILSATEVMDVKDFVVLASMAFSFYFTKPNASKPEDIVQ